MTCCSLSIGISSRLYTFVSLMGDSGANSPAASAIIGSTDEIDARWFAWATPIYVNLYCASRVAGRLCLHTTAPLGAVSS